MLECYLICEILKGRERYSGLFPERKVRVTRIKKQFVNSVTIFTFDFWKYLKDAAYKRWYKNFQQSIMNVHNNIDHKTIWKATRHEQEAAYPYAKKSSSTQVIIRAIK